MSSLNLYLTDRKVYREYLLHDGFSEAFVDNFIIPMHFDNRLDPKDTRGLLGNKILVASLT